MRDFPLHTGLAIATLTVLFSAANRLAPQVRGPEVTNLSHLLILAPALSLRTQISQAPAVVGQTVRARATVEPPVLLDDSDGALDHFYESLVQVERRERGAISRIVHYGDSPTTAELVTGEVRALLQRKFGDAGPGFIVPEKPWAWYRHRGVEVYAHGWLIAPVGRFESRDGMFGLAGVSFTGYTSARSTIYFGMTRCSHIEAWYLRQPGGGVFITYASARELGRVDTSGDSKSAGFESYDVPPTADFGIQVASGNVRFFGITAEKPGPGVVYDSLGVNGGSISVLSRQFEERHLTAELSHRRPNLVVINYGTNEAGYDDFVDHHYADELREAIRRIRRAVPDASVLVMSPMDRGQRSASGAIETMPTIPRIAAIQRHVAREAGCGFFDTFDGMGGEGTMARWYNAEPRLVAADLIHPHGDGGKQIAAIFYREIMTGLERYKARQARQDTGDASQ